MQKGHGRSRRTDQSPAADLDAEEEVAVKLEHHSIDPSLPSDEFEIYESLAGGKGIPKVMQFCHENNIIFCRLPPHTSHKLQPYNVGVFGPFKTAYRELEEELYRGGANAVGKQHFTFLYSQARCAAFTSRNIKSGWAKAGLYPFNPDRVLQDIQKKHDEKETSRTGRRGRKRRHPAPEPWRGKKSRAEEIEEASREIKALGMEDYCSVF